MTRERRLLFGSVAEAYERYRPGYPAALFDDVLAYAGLAPGDPVLEVGAGTGKATRELLARGLRVTCLEPDAEGFGLLCSAQAWHWVEPRARREHTLRALRPGGAVALWWNDHELPQGVQEQVEAIYRRREPQLLAEAEALRRSVDRTSAEELAQAGMRDIEHRQYGPSGSIDAAAFAGMVGTTSSYLVVPEERRRALVDEVASVLAAHEPVPSPSSTSLWLARAPAA